MVEDGFEAGWPALRLVFEEASQKLTREDILAEWPADHAKAERCRKAKRLWLSRGASSLIRFLVKGKAAAPRLRFATGCPSVRKCGSRISSMH